MIILTLVVGAILSTCCFANSLEFDGTDDYIAIPESLDDEYNTSDRITVAAWVYLDDLTTDYAIFSDGAGGSADVMFWMDQGDTANYRVLMAGIGSTDTTTANNATSAAWQHVAFTYDGTEITIYVDGVHENTGGSSAEISPTNNSGVNIGDTTNNAKPLKGQMDDVRVYDRALSDDEIRQLYRAGRGVTRKRSQGELSAGLIGHWPFDEAEIGSDATLVTIRDRSGHGEDGTANDGADGSLVFDRPALSAD